MQRMQEKSISLEQKLRYLKEVENIYRLSKKVLPPAGKTWNQIADQVLQKALGAPVRPGRQQMQLRPGRMHHLQSADSARVIERTLRNGVLHPDILHTYRGDNVQTVRERPLHLVPDVRMTADTPDVQHYVQHGGTEVHYPEGHLQGYGFVPRTHITASHVPLEAAGGPDAVVPSTTTSYH